MKDDKTLFEKIGGMDAVNAAVEIFYKKVLKDDRIKDFFINTNMESQIGKQKSFLAYAFGAPLKYTGKSMRDAHAHMDLTSDHFQAVVEHLIATLQELNVPDELIAEVGIIAESTKNDVLAN